MAIRTIIEFRVKPGEAERFENAYRAGQMLERATTNPGFIRGELLRSITNPDTFLATAEWRAEADYRAWQDAYASLPKTALDTMVATLEGSPTTRICNILLTADESTEVMPGEST